MTSDNSAAINGRPLQIIPFSEKTPSWFQRNGEYYMKMSSFAVMSQVPLEDSGILDMDTLYNAYNNQFPAKWFKHITNPLSAKEKKHQAFPAKLRPVGILRTNVDLLLGEYPKRPFSYNVANLGESGFNNKVHALEETLKQNLTEHFIQAALMQMQASGQPIPPEAVQKLQQQPPVPADVKANFDTSYQDAVTIKAQKWLRRNIRDKEMRRKFLEMFKDWLIVGECVSYKGIENGDLVYRRQSPKDFSSGKSADQQFSEDGEWCVARRFLTLSDIVDEFYEDLSKQDHLDLENKTLGNSPTGMYNYMAGLGMGGSMDGTGLIPVYHIQWKGRKKVGIMSYFDQETFQYVEMEVDEDYKVDESRGEKVEWQYRNEVYEVSCIADKLWLKGQAVPVQRGEATNHSKCKLSYNRRAYSDTHSRNISVMEIGMPFQIMFIIVNYILEKTIAKSKGKIFVFDKNAVPNQGEWTEEKFFYYGEAMGYVLVDRNQKGVDKSWQQYQVLDMSLFENIKQLIELKESIKQEWDDVLGISRQRKGQTLSSDGQGVNERAVFQSSVITDMIFLGFEEFVERELQAMIDYMKFMTSNGEKSAMFDPEYGVELMEIFPEDFSMEDLGVFVERSSDIIEKLKKMEGYAQAMIQNSGKPSTVLEIIDAVNIAELKQKLRAVENAAIEQEQQAADADNDREARIEEIKKDFLAYQSLLDRENMDAEYDRKEDLEYIKGAFSTYSFQDGDSNDNGIPDTAEVQKLLQNQQKINDDYEHKKEDRKLRKTETDLKKQKMQHDMAQDKIKNKQADKKLAIDRKKASQRPKTSK